MGGIGRSKGQINVGNYNQHNKKYYGNNNQHYGEDKEENDDLSKRTAKPVRKHYNNNDKN